MKTLAIQVYGSAIHLDPPRKPHEPPPDRDPDWRPSPLEERYYSAWEMIGRAIAKRGHSLVVSSDHRRSMDFHIVKGYAACEGPKGGKKSILVIAPRPSHLEREARDRIPDRLPFKGGPNSTGDPNFDETLNLAFVENSSMLIPGNYRLAETLSAASAHCMLVSGGRTDGRESGGIVYGMLILKRGLVFYVSDFGGMGKTLSSLSPRVCSDNVPVPLTYTAEELLSEEAAERLVKELESSFSGYAELVPPSVAILASATGFLAIMLADQNSTPVVVKLASLVSPPQASPWLAAGAVLFLMLSFTVTTLLTALVLVFSGQRASFNTILQRSCFPFTIAMIIGLSAAIVRPATTPDSVLLVAVILCAVGPTEALNKLVDRIRRHSES